MLRIVKSTRMNATQFIRCVKTNAILHDVKPTAPEPSTRVKVSAVPDAQGHSPRNWEKIVLVWTKRFPNKESIPQMIPMDTIQTAMSRARIRIANYIMICTVIGCIYIVTTGKREVDETRSKGEKVRDDFRRQITAEYKASLEKDALKK